MNLPVLQVSGFAQLLMELHQFAHHVVVVASFVRHQAVAAVFDAAI